MNRCNCPLIEQEDQFQFVNNWTKITGNHQIKFGADIRYARNLRVPSDNHRAGELTFARDRTSLAGSASPTGVALATFLLGDVTTFKRYVSTSTNAAERQKRFYFYGQDTWRATLQADHRLRSALGHHESGVRKRRCQRQPPRLEYRLAPRRRGWRYRPQLQHRKKLEEPRVHALASPTN